MPIYIDSSDRLYNEQAASLALTCPHCQVFSHVTLQAVPRFADLSAHKPRYVGMVYRCDACNSPIFLRYTAKLYCEQRIELSSQFYEVERPKEKFSYTYLPEDIDTLMRETLQCYSQGVFNAFATMCRRTLQGVFDDLGENGKLRLFDQLNDIRDMADIDQQTFANIKRVIFGTDADPVPNMPLFDEQQAGVLLEVTKDLLYQCYVRRGRLQQAMLVRRYFSDESESKSLELEAPRAEDQPT